MQDSSNSPTITDNPYLPRPTTYKDALLADAKDTTTRIGINTFKLINSLCSTRHRNDDEDMSIASEDTTQKNNMTTLSSYRMRFQTTLTDTSPDTFMTDLSE